MHTETSAVLFDLDGTLLDRVASIRAFVSGQHARLAALHHIPLERYVARFEALDSHGSVWKDVVYRSLVREFGVAAVRWQELLLDYESAFSSCCIPFPDLHTTLSALRHSGFKIGIVTNGRDTFQRGVIRALDLDDMLSVTVISESEGVRKPNPEIFHRAIRRLNATVKTSVYVGDNPEIDIDGARNAGMKAVWKRNAIWPLATAADGVIDDLGELVRLVPLLLSHALRHA